MIINLNLVAIYVCSHLTLLHYILFHALSEHSKCIELILTYFFIVFFSYTLQTVKDLYGSVFELSLSALFVTPRTVGARVSLTEEQLLLWPADAEKEVEAAASLPLGSRAHVTLGCAEGVEPVQTGLDLLEILALQQGGQKGELVEEMELGSLTYYGEGRWLLSLREPICAPACFSSFYGQKELEPAKKEPEKKKKQKCTIL